MGWWPGIAVTRIWSAKLLYTGLG